MGRKDERIRELETRIVWLEARIAVLMKRPRIVPWQPEPQHPICPPNPWRGPVVLAWNDGDPAMNWDKHLWTYPLP